jgi:hypothetical protein
MRRFLLSGIPRGQVEFVQQERTLLCFWWDSFFLSTEHVRKGGDLFVWAGPSLSLPLLADGVVFSSQERLFICYAETGLFRLDLSPSFFRWRRVIGVSDCLC